MLHAGKESQPQEQLNNNYNYKIFTILNSVLLYFYKSHQFNLNQCFFYK